MAQVCHGQDTFLSPYKARGGIELTLKYGFCNKSFRKDEPLTSWTLFSTYLSSKLDFPLSKRLERENLILMINMLKKVFNW